MTVKNCGNCAYCEYHNEIFNGVNYNGYYCGAFEYLTDNAKIENIDTCEYAEE